MSRRTSHGWAWPHGLFRKSRVIVLLIAILTSCATPDAATPSPSVSILASRMPDSTPTSPGDAPHVDTYGRFSYALPAGWTNVEDNIDGFVLRRDDGPDGAGIYVFVDVRAHKQGPDCPHEITPDVGGSASEISAWLESLPGLAISQIAPVTVGGLRGTQLDIALDASWTQNCPWDPTTPYVPLFLYADHGDLDWGIAGDGRMRLYVLELEPARAVLIDVEAQDEISWQSFLPEAVSVVKSFTFLH